ncbi:MAG: selenocysteine-specific translation elongation factor [Planctomycetota bacterium]
MPPTHLILGTAGHIDHGKTSLVAALTGVDTDRLPEEKQRGMTIDLGFAEIQLGDCQAGVIDVPGHERFIKNMLAGAGAVDLALLVVAADDSVMPQTREHVAILRLLGVRHAAVALTKCDLKEPDWLELVESDIRQCLAYTRFADAPIVRTAVPPGGPNTGIDELLAALTAAAADCRPADSGVFRMHVDRAFTVAGRGTVVTGAVASGGLSEGDAVEWFPPAKTIQVRGLENHGRPVSDIHRGQRAAINLAKVHHTEVHRGDVLATPGLLRPSQWITARVTALADSPRPLKHRARYTTHLGAAAHPCELKLLQSNELPPGESALAQLKFAAPVTALWGDAFVLRSESPVETLGGGTVLQPNTRPIRRSEADLLQRLTKLESTSPAERVTAAIAVAGYSPADSLTLCRECGVPPSNAPALLDQLTKSKALIAIGSEGKQPLYTLPETLEKYVAELLATLDQLHAKSPTLAAIPLAELKARVKNQHTEGVLNQLVKEGTVAASSQGFALAGRGPSLSPDQESLLERILATYRTRGLQPPTAEELAEATAADPAELRPLVTLAVDRGQLVHLGGPWFVDEAAESDARRRLDAAFQEEPLLTVAQIRDILETSRKYAVPLCEYLDGIGFTKRRGDQRTRGNATL